MNVNKESYRWWDTLAAGCLVCAALALTVRLTSTTWSNGLDNVQYLAIIGVILGLFLGQSQFSARLAGWLCLSYSLYLVPWQLGLVQSQSMPWDERLIALFDRLSLAIHELFKGNPVADPILFIGLVGIIFWSIGITSGYFLTRHGSGWASVLPSGFAILLIQHYDPNRSSSVGTIGAFFFFSLLLIMRMTVKKYQKEWQDQGMPEEPEVVSDLVWAGVITVTLVVLVAWNIPSLAASSAAAKKLWVSATRPWQTLHDNMADLVVSLRGAGGVVSDFYGAELLMGTKAAEGESILFTVKAPRPAEGQSYTWKVREYDRYTVDRGWETSVTAEISFSPDDQTPFDFPAWDGQKFSEFSFTNQTAVLHTFYLPAQPVWIDKRADLIYGYKPEGELDIVRIMAKPALTAGERYTVRALTGIPYAEGLRASSPDYPDWLRERYLQLPENYSPRLQALAEQVTGNAATPYDKVQAVTRYLRQNMTYAATVGDIPAGADPIEWFLFEEKSGYCNYFASAEVLMLRSLGIPSRLAAGFAQGEYDDQAGRYILRQKDAHAWPEVYFMGYGWVAFEPTAAQPDKVFPSNANLRAGMTANQQAILPDRLMQIREPNEYPEKPATNEQETADLEKIILQQRQQRLYRYLGGIFSAVSVVVLAVFSWRNLRKRYRLPPFAVYLENVLIKNGITPPGWLRNWSILGQLSPIQKAYRDVERSLNVLGETVPAAVTLTERTKIWTERLPEAAQAVSCVLDEYQKEIYSQTPPDATLVLECASQVRKLAFRARLRRWAAMLFPGMKAPVTHQVRKTGRSE